MIAVVSNIIQRWLDNVTDNCYHRGWSIVEATHLATDRQCWRTYTAVTACPGIAMTTRSEEDPMFLILACIHCRTFGIRWSTVSPPNTVSCHLGHSVDAICIARRRIKSCAFVLCQSYYIALRLNSDKIESARRSNTESIVTIQTSEFWTILLGLKQHS